MPELLLDQLTLHYETEGKGPPLVLIPGMLSDSASWFPLVDPLSEHFTLIRPDPRGAGRSRPLDAEITLDTLAEDILALATNLGHDRFAVAGHSLGGLVAARLSAIAPERLSGLVIIASTPKPSGRLPHLFQTLCDIRAKAGGERLWLMSLFPWLFHDGFFRDPAAVEAAVQANLDYPHMQTLEAMRHQTKALGRLNLRSLPGRFETPALVLLAEDDAMIAAPSAKATWEARGAQARIIADAGHSLHWDQPAMAVEAIVDFLSA